ncbi:MAG: molybdopterin-dependent oxidoreductase [Chloroflexi bacterium]|nr:molybdopterin-dependent oxidoreductase [Chloroflexota bacterium]
MSQLTSPSSLTGAVQPSTDVSLASSSSAVRPRSTSLAMQFGLALLVFSLIELVTGLMFYVARAELPTGLSAALLTSIHIYVGLVSIPFLMVKVWLGIPLLRRSGGQRRASLSGFQRVNSVGLVILFLTMYVSGLVLYLAPAFPKWWFIQIHLWSSVLALVPTSVHLVRHLITSWRAFRWRSAQLAERLATPNRRLLPRRAFLGLVAAGWATVAVRQLANAVEPLAVEDPNDFPVTLVTAGYKVQDASTWEIRVHGDVERPLTFRFPELRAMPQVSHRYMLDCISGWSVDREWGGVPLGYILEQARPIAPDGRVFLRSVTGYEQVTSIAGALRPESLLCTHVNGVSLADEHGYPVRFMTKDVIGEFCVKWLAEIEVRVSA